MVSALRERAIRQSTAPSAVDGARPSVLEAEVEFTWPLRANRIQRRPRRHWPRWLDGRRIGLALSIAAAMVASAIGGALAASRRPAVDVVPVAAPASAASSAHTAAASAPTVAAAPTEAAHASAPASAAAEAPATAAALAPGADLTFGLDINGDGVPDSLERFVRKTIAAPATRVAARRYYRLALPLAARAQQGEVLPHAEKQALFRAAECYWLSAAEDAIADAPNLNGRASLVGAAAADRMQALAEALQRFDYRVGAGKRLACG